MVPLPEEARRWGLALAILTAMFVLSATLHGAAARLNGDEGWYALAAVNVLHHRAPYRDFAFTQMPLVAYVEAGWFALSGVGIAQARYLSLGLATLCFTVGSTAVARRAGFLGGLLAGLLILTSPSLIYTLTAARTQPLTLALEAVVILGAGSLSSAWGVPVLLAASTAMVFTRLSMLPVVVCAVGLSLCKGPRRAAVGWTAVAIAVSIAVLLTLRTDDRFGFGVVGFHREFYGFMPWRADNVYLYFVRGVIADQAPILVLFISALVVWALRRRTLDALGEDLRAMDPWLAFCTAAYVATTAIHLSRPVAFPVFQGSNVLFAFAVAAAVWSRWAARTTGGRTVLFALVLPMVLLAMPFEDDVLHLGGDTGTGRLEEVSTYVRALSGGRGRIFTPATEIAVETGLDEIPGWEMGEFSWFPSMDTARARHLHVSTLVTLAADLATLRPGVVCLTRRNADLLQGTAALASIQREYTLTRTFARYGQFDEPLYVFQRTHP